MTSSLHSSLVGKNKKEILEIIKPLLDDISTSEDPNAFIMVDDEKITMKQLSIELLELTPLGIEYINGWLEAQGLG